MDHAKQSIEHIQKSGEFVCRAKRRIFMEHEIYSSDGKLARKATREDIKDIAENMKEAAASGNPARLTFGHTMDDQYDAKGTLVRHFTEKEQPATRGFWLNPQYEEIKDGKDKGKLALYADQWIQKTVPDDNGKPTDGPSYAATFPGRSPEYLKRKKLIDSVALLRRTPALDLGIDILPYIEAHPERVFYAADLTSIACVEDSKGKWRYAYEDDMDAPAPSTPSQAGSPAAPADDRNPTGQADDGWTPDHQHFAEEACNRTSGMHHTHYAALMDHMHKTHGPSLGLPPDKKTPHGGMAGAAPAAPGAAVPGPTSAPATAAPGSAPATPPVNKPQPLGASMQPENTRMSADQQELAIQRYSERIAALEAEVAENRKSRLESDERAMYAELKTKLEHLYMAGRDSINVDAEIQKCKDRKYSQQQIDWHIEELRRIPVGDTVVTGGFIPVLPTAHQPRQPETADQYSGNPDRDYERSLEVQRYARQTGKTMEEAEKWWIESHQNGQLNGTAR